MSFSQSATDALAKQFCEGTLSKLEWTHHAHLGVGLWFLLRYSPEETLERLRQGIRHYNQISGVENTSDSGYHETITRFYIIMIDHFLRQQDHSQSVDGLFKKLIRVYGDASLPYTFYRRETLMSPEARAQWILPDLKPLPETTLN